MLKGGWFSRAVDRGRERQRSPQPRFDMTRSGAPDEVDIDEAEFARVLGSVMPKLKKLEEARRNIHSAPNKHAEARATEQAQNLKRAINNSLSRINFSVRACKSCSKVTPWSNRIAAEPKCRACSQGCG